MQTGKLREEVLAPMIPETPPIIEAEWRDLEPKRRRLSKQSVFIGVWALCTLLLLSILIVEHVGPIASLVMGPSATIIVHPDHKTINQTIQVDGSQVGLRAFSMSLPSQTKEVVTTGIGVTSAKEAYGTVTLYNEATYSQTVLAGTVIAGLVVTNGNVTVPAGNPPYFGIATVSAHTINVGQAANIAPLTINSLCCLSGLSVKNLGYFYGGQDSRTYKIVSQSDVDQAANPLIENIEREAQGKVQIGQDEKLLSPIKCIPHVSTDKAIGEEASKVTVKIDVRCVGTAYNSVDAMNLVSRNTTQGNYIQIGDVQLQVTNTEEGKVQVTSSGLYVYSFSDTQIRDMKQKVAGRKRQDAKAILEQVNGIQSVEVSSDIPDNQEKITVKIEA